MNKLIWCLVALALVGGCKESDPPIDFGGKSALVLKDTVYTTSDIPAADFRGVLVEDLTGVRCVACPNAADVAADVKANETTNPVVIIGYYPQAPRSLTEPFPEYLDMRTEVAQLVGTNIYNFSNILPAGGVNRRLFDGEQTLNAGFAKWVNQAKVFDGEKSIVNMELEKEQVNDSTINVAAKFTFVSDADYTPFVTVLVTEDGIKHPQYYSGGTDKEYKHKHVVRLALTSYNGNPLITGSAFEAVKGTVVEKGWQITITNGINIDEANIAVLVNYNDANNKEVIQCQELKLK
ncbi:Omp28-related outer membrane protein [Bacteroidia bacterium]|nr:Omp28-related outer membrane protein [Bacteroidia bacterium]MDB9882086.1 Omp28-related outer membrane protein [Bacteroidia bacterium]